MFKTKSEKLKVFRLTPPVASTIVGEKVVPVRREPSPPYVFQQNLRKGV